MLEEKRKMIDSIDTQIVELLAMRLEIAQAIGHYKKENNLEIQNKEREAQLLEKLKNKAQEKGLRQELIVELYEKILAESREVQKSV